MTFPDNNASEIRINEIKLLLPTVWRSMDHVQHVNCSGK